MIILKNPTGLYWYRGYSIEGVICAYYHDGFEDSPLFQLGSNVEYFDLGEPFLDTFTEFCNSIGADGIEHQEDAAKIALDFNYRLGLRWPDLSESEIQKFHDFPLAFS